MYTVIFPTNGIVLFILVLIALITIVSLLLARKLGFKQLIAAILLAFATIYRIIEGLGSDIGFPPVISHVKDFNFIPFKKLFFVPWEGYWESEAALLSYLSPILIDLAVVFIFGIIWGFLAPIIFKISDNKKYIKISVAYMLPVQLAVNLSHMFYIAYYDHFDMGTYVLLFLGCLFGRSFFNLIKANLRREKNHDLNREAV